MEATQRRSLSRATMTKEMEMEPQRSGSRILVQRQVRGIAVDIQTSALPPHMIVTATKRESERERYSEAHCVCVYARSLVRV